MAELPIIVLAFANEQEGRRYLRDLPEELRRLQDILREAERRGLCRLELLPNATLDQIFDVFTRNRDRVTILHYAGHADSDRLLLESGAGGSDAAHAAGLATFLGQRRGLQLVFLNGCSTRAQVAGLLEAGVAAVIATARAIDDRMAREFAAAFYIELAAGQPLRAAYVAARGRVLAGPRGGVPKAYYRSRDLGHLAAEEAAPDPVDDHGFPWEFRPGTELVERWSLPDAAGRPEFGLPPLPEQDLPEEPFRNLSWFTAEHAEIFFGRGYQVRELYEQVTDPTGPPILLLYGASGVGKSSLLDAGLVPRLESAGNLVRYRRRDQQKGLAGSLSDALPPAEGRDDLRGRWRAEEASHDQALFLFLDQAEEVFTRPDPARPQELDEFIAVLGAALGGREQRPRGKLVVGFRKEWLAELDRRFAEAKLPRTKVFLKPLDRRGIIEAIRGPARPGRLERQYRLAIEDGLPEVIADNLLADAGSAVAPTLEVFLTRMWERARQADPDRPRFDRPLYESLKAEGYLLKDVLDEGLKAIRRWDPVVEESGLALDVLAYHTTELGTAAQHTRAELDRRYANQAHVVDRLLARCRESYLLIEVEAQPDSATRSTRLAHDLLAPLVQQRFRLSVAPGQRARRLLENRAPEWRDGQTGTVLDRFDLATVEAGAPGMRAWDVDDHRTGEARLVEASRRAESQRRTARNVLRAAAAVAVVAIALFGAIAWVKWREAEKETKIAEKETEKARLTSANLMLDRGLALARQDEAQRGLHWMARALATNPPASPDLDRAARANLEAWGRQVPSLQDAWEHPGGVYAMVFSPDGRTVATRAAGKGETSTDLRFHAYLWDVASGERIAGPLGDQGMVDWIAFNSDGSILVTVGFPHPGIAGGSGEARLWAARTGRPIGQPVSIGANASGNASAYALVADGSALLVGCSDGAVRRCRFQAGEQVHTLVQREGPVQALAISPDGATILAGSGPRAQLWDVGKAQPIGPPLEHQGLVLGAMFCPDGKMVLTWGDDADGMVKGWDARSGRPMGALVNPPEPRSHGRAVSFVTVSPDQRLILTCSLDGTAKLWDIKSGQLRMLYYHTSFVQSAAFSPDGRLVATGCADKRARLFETTTGRRVGQPIEHSGQVVSVAFDSPGGRLFTVGLDPIVQAWDVTSVRAERRMVKPGATIAALAFSPDGRKLLAHAGQGVVWFLDAATGDPVDQSITFAKPMNLDRVRFSPDGRLVATANSDADHSEAQVWEVASGKPVSPPFIERKPRGGIFDLAFSPDGKTLLTGCYAAEGAVRLWKVDGGQMLWTYVNHWSGFRLLFHPDGRTIYCAGYKGIRVLDAATGRPTGPEFSYPGTINALRLSPDGTALAGGGDDRTARLWDVATGRPIGEPLEHLDTILGLAFSPDGKKVATGSLDKTARVWDAITGQPMTQPLAHDGEIGHVEFLHDGKSVITNGSVSAARLWDVATGKEIGPGLSHSGGVVGSSAMDRDGRVIATGCLDGTIKFWDVPGLIEGDIHEIGNEVEAKTGMRLDERDAIHFLGAGDWRRLTPRSRKVSRDRGTVPGSDPAVSRSP
jgi:WD40 repeat protein